MLKYGGDTIKHLGDITKIDGSKITPVDIITFGSPCQNLSVAGNRQGLQGSESGLFVEAVRVIKEMRNATKQLSMHGANDDRRIFPRIAIWENVVGAYSSNNGEDFRCVLEMLARIENPEVSIPKPKKWSGAGCIELPHGCITWRTHDAQYFGVPQRRRRISLVVDFREEPEPEIQFIEQSLSGNTEPSKQTGEATSGNVGESADTAINMHLIDPPPLSIDRASFNQGANAKYDFAVEEDIAQPIVARGPGGVMQTK